MGDASGEPLQRRVGMEGGRASRLWGGPAEKKSKQKRTRTGAAQRPSTDTRSLTNPGWHIRYLFPPSEEKLMLITPFLRRSACTRVISICEEHGGWSNDERSAYPFATSDLEVPLQVACVPVPESAGVTSPSQGTQRGPASSEKLTQSSDSTPGTP